MYKINIENIGKVFRILFRNKTERKRLKNKDFSIMSNTCIGGVICHDMGQRFLSPTINLYIKPHQFVKLMENLPYYFSLPMKKNEFMTEHLGYPVGTLGDITIFFKHYASFEQAQQKWEERKLRINYENLYVMMTDRWCCSKSDLERFEKLPFKNKVCFTAKQYPDYPSTRRVQKNNDEVCVGVITNIVNIFGKRLYQYAEDFDYIEFLNKKNN